MNKGFIIQYQVEIIHHCWALFQQVILDMLTIGESTNWNPKPPIDTMYHALGARLTPVQWSDLTELVNLLSILDGSVEIQQVFEVLKLGEVTSFKSSVGNVRTLLHGTSSTNMIGVLARYEVINHSSFCKSRTEL